MIKGSNFRLLTTYNESATVNMGIDKTLIDSFKRKQEPVLRFYTWQKSFTVGISQDPLDFTDAYPEFNHNHSKRMTGGGVLFHGHDLSYSLLVPTSHLEGLSVKASYERICTFLLEFYKSLGLDAKYAKDIQSIALSKSAFCQVGFEAYDIIANGLKIGGNAQKRAKQFIFQHGSIPLYKPDNKEEMGNSLEELGIQISYEEAIMKLSKAFEKSFEVNLIVSELDSEEKEYLETIIK